MSKLFEPISFRGLELKNRIMISPMCQYSCTDGLANDWHLIHLGQLALGGTGLLCLEATAVEAIGRISTHCLGLWSDAHEAALLHVLESVRRHSGMPMAIQLCHAGRKASSSPPWMGGALVPPSAGGWPVVAPSAVAHAAGEPAPITLDKAGIRRIRDAFADAARRSARLGLDAIELHAAHGYLLHQFLSPLANERTDEYGGSLANRIRFPLEVFDAVREAWPADKPLGVRVSATDWVEGGWDPDQTVELARALKSRGCDWLDCSSGGVSTRQQIALSPGYQVPFASRVRCETGMATIAVGLITEPAEAEAVIARGDADMVALARGMLYDPRWAWHAAAQLGGTVSVPPQYGRCAPREAQSIFAGARSVQR